MASINFVCKVTLKKMDKYIEYIEENFEFNKIILNKVENPATEQGFI